MSQSFFNTVIVILMCICTYLLYANNVNINKSLDAQEAYLQNIDEFFDNNNFFIEQ